MIFLYSDSFSFFTLCVFMIYFTTGFIDTLGEGMTAIITKMNERVKALKGEDDEESNDEGKAIGFFFVFRTLIRTIAIWGGGIMSSEKVSVGWIYLFMAIFPALLFLYTLFIFREDKVRVSQITLLRKNYGSPDAESWLETSLPSSRFWSIPQCSCLCCLTSPYSPSRNSETLETTYC